MPKETAAALAGLRDNKVSLAFNVAAGTGFQLNPFGSPTVTDSVSGRSLVLTLASGQPTVAFALKPGAITVSRAIEKAAGGLTTKKPKKKHKKKRHDATAAKAKKKKKAKATDTIKSETINLSVSDTTGLVTSLPITIAHPH
jgi:flagellar biosynthesis component FlhA